VILLQLRKLTQRANRISSKAPWYRGTAVSILRTYVLTRRPPLRVKAAYTKNAKTQKEDKNFIGKIAFWKKRSKLKNQ
jgi:hypothetical protein